MQILPACRWRATLNLYIHTHTHTWEEQRSCSHCAKLHFYQLLLSNAGNCRSLNSLCNTETTDWENNLSLSPLLVFLLSLLRLLHHIVLADSVYLHASIDFWLCRSVRISSGLIKVYLEALWLLNMFMYYPILVIKCPGLFLHCKVFFT